MNADPYKTLDISKTATEAEIKAAYRKLAKQYHPDLHPDKKDARTKFNEIGAAYQLLSDADKRAAFDRGEVDASGQQKQYEQYTYRDFAEGPQANRYYHFNQADRFTDQAAGDGTHFTDLFSSLFGDHFKQEPGAPTSQTAALKLEVAFLEAALGAKKRIKFTDGRELDLTIPAGIDEGQQLRLKGQGLKNKQGMAEDVLIEIAIRPHPQFTRQGKNIHSEIPVGFQESILGSKINVPTIHGNVAMTVPTGANSGTKLRLKNKGIQNGDQLVTIRIVMPPKIDAELEKIVSEWAKTHTYNPRNEEVAV